MNWDSEISSHTPLGVKVNNCKEKYNNLHSYFLQRIFTKATSENIYSIKLTANYAWKKPVTNRAQIKVGFSLIMR